MGTNITGDKYTFICRLCVLPILMSMCISAANVTSFLLVDSSQETLLLGNTNCAVNLQFESTGSNFTLTAQLNTGTELNTNNAVINVGAKTVLYTFNSTFFNEIFGQYTLTLTLTPNVGMAASKQLILYYEEPISGVQIQSSTYVLVSDQLQVTAKIQKGSNFNVTWVYELSSSISKSYIGQPKNASESINFTTPGEKTITVYITNMISNASTEVTVFAYYDLTGVTIHTENNIFLVNDSLNISVLQDSAAQTPKGSLYLNVSYDNGHVMHKNLTVAGGVFTPVLYQYATPGNYTASATLYSMVDKLVVNFSVSVWEVLQVTMTMPDDAAVSNNVSIQLQNLPSCIFNFNISLGNGDTLSKSSDVTTSLSYIYVTFGTFNVTVIAWTPAQMISLTHRVTVHQLCDVVSFIKQGQQIINLEAGQNVNISFKFECCSTKLTFDAEDGEKQLDTSSAVINYSNKTVYYVLQSSFLVQSYGHITINFTLTPFNGALKTLQLDLNYEEPVDGLSINVPYYVVIGEPVDLGLSLTAGSNIIVCRCLNNVECVSTSYMSITEDLSQNITLSTSGEHNISVNVSNTHSMKSITKSVFGIRRLNGLNITLSDDSIETTDVVEFTVTCDDNAVHPMGSLKLNITFCGSSQQTYDVGSDLITQDIPDYIISKNCSVQGDYNINLILYNQVDSLTFPFSIRIWDHISVKLNFTNTAKVFTKINFTLIDTPPSNFYFNVDYGDGNVNEPIVDVNQPFNILPWTHAYNNPGDYVVNFTAWNYLYRITNLHSVTILPRDVTMFDMATGESSTMNLTEGGQKDINMQFESDAFDFVFTARIVEIGDILNNSTTVINVGGGSATYTLSSAYLNQPFGQYDLNLTLAPIGGSAKSLIVKINYEETITGLVFNGPSFLPVGYNSEVKVQLSTASNIGVVWTFPPNDAFSATINGTVRELSYNHTFTSPGIYIVTLYASNSLSDAFLSMNITVIYNLNGFTVETVTDLVATLENVIIVPRLAHSTLLPMGTLSLKADYKDGTVADTFQLNSYISDMKNALYNVSHKYNTQGNYTINVTIENEVDNQVYMLSVYIWDPLFVSLASVSEVKVFNPVEFYFINASNSGFYYTIEYGDDTPLKNLVSTTLYHPFNVNPWNYSYNEPGTYSVIFDGWNEYYHTSNQYYIRVLARNVTKLEIADNKTNIVYLIDGTDSNVVFDFETDAFTLSLDAKLASNGSAIDSSSVSFDMASNRVTYTIKSSLLNIGYGKHDIVVTVSPVGGFPMPIGFILYYEAAITGLAINNTLYYPVDEKIALSVSFDSGSNMLTQLTIDDNLIYNNETASFTIPIVQLYTFTTPGEHNISITAINSVSNSSMLKTITAYYRLNGFAISSIDGYFQTTENATIYINLESTAKMPMGTLHLNVSYGDHQQEVLSLTEEYIMAQNFSQEVKHKYMIQGNYTVDAIISNQFGSVPFSFVIYIWDKIYVTLSAKTLEKVFIPIELSLENPPNSAFHYSIDYGDGSVQSETTLNLSSLYNVQPWNYTYNTFGDFNITVKAWNPFYVRTCWHLITISARNVTMLEIADNGTNVIKLIDGSETIVTLEYESDAPSYTFEAFYAENENPLNSSTCEIDLSAKRVTYTIKYSFVNVDFGTYEIDLKLSPHGGYAKTKRIILEYEEQISGLSMTQYDFLPLNESILFSASLLSGSNINITWTYGTQGTNSFQVSRYNENISRYFTFSIPGVYNITISVCNSVSIMSTFMIVNLFYRINGFSVPTTLTPFEAQGNATLPFLLDETADLPMGNLSCNITYGDAASDLFDLNPLIPSMKNGTHDIRHVYSIQGNYTVNVFIWSEVDSLELTAIVYIWDEILVSLNSKTEEKVFNKVEFKFVNPQAWGFFYRITYGNDEGKLGLNEDLYSPFSVLPWNYTYFWPGHFNVTLTAWNPFYVRSHTYDINILPRDVTALDIQNGGAYMLDLAEGLSVGVTLDYVSDAFAYNLTATLNTGDELDTSSAVINQIASVVSYNITSSMINTYGTYGVDLTLDPYGGASKTIELVIFYEESISGFSISRYPFVPINESFLFTITFVTGSNVQVEWFLEDMCLTDFPGKPRTVYHNYTFTIPGVHNVTAVAENSVGSAYDSMLIYTYYRINGFTFISANATVQTTEYYYFTVYLNASALHPMGTLKVNMSYGDNHYEIIDLSSNVTEMQTTGVFITHMYPIQGNYTATAEIFTEIDTQMFSFDVYIWDKLEMILNYQSAAKVGENVTFDFLNPPKSGFYFHLEYDDGKILDQSSVDLFSSYNVEPWTHKFKTNNIYNMTLRAWNEWYSVSCPYVITIQYPIPASSVILLPVADEIPVPDGIVIFNMTLIEDEISPTDVFCTYDYHDGKDENVSTAIDFGVSIITSYNYTFGGEKHVNFSCWNLVSSMVKRSYIMVREFTVEDFHVTYQNPVNMNMTIAETTPTGDHDLDRKAVHIPVNTTFYVSLFNCSRFPPDVYFTWNFDDGTVETDLITSFNKLHQFDRRGTYSVSIDIFDERTENQTQKIYSITMGVIDFTVNPMVGIVNVHSFTFRAQGIMGSAEYKFDSYSNETMNYVSTTNPAEATVIYTLRGSYLVSVIGHNSTLQETVYLEQLVKIDFSIDNQLNMTLSNMSVYMPPGELNITLSLGPYSERKPEVMCVLLSGDLIDTGTHIEVRNITVEEPLEFHYHYLTLGYHPLKVNCSNLASSTFFSALIDVYNPCFTRDGIFDRQYSRPEKAMRSLTSVPTQLTSRMGVLCGEKEASFQWTIWSFDIINQEKTYIMTTSTSRSTFIFTPGLLNQGLYYIRLNVSLDGTWLSEFTYIELEKPPPIAYIIGGTKMTARIITRFYDVDALTGSFDPDCGYGCNENFTFSFNCTRVDTADFDYIESSANNGSYDGECITYNVSRGILRLNISEGFFGYIVTVVVRGGNKESTFVQYIKVIEGEPPDVVSNCTLNCFEKTAVQSKLIMVAWCKDCLSWERPNYSWGLEKYNNDTGKFEAVDNFQSMVSTSLNEVSVVINENQLEEGTMYSLILEASADGRNGTTVAIQKLYANYPAYGGYCRYFPIIGFAAVDFFQIHCANWKDEGINLLQNETRDTTAEEPLMYLYEAVNDCEEGGVTTQERTELYRGGESTLINITLPIGCATKGYMLRLNVRICDRFGDCTLDGHDVTVKENPTYVSLSGDNTTAFVSLFNTIEYTYNITNAGGNDITLVRLICSSSSLISVNESAVPAPMTEEDILSGNVEEINETSTSPLDNVKIEKLEWLSESVTKAVGADNSSTVQKQMSPADAQQAMRALESCVQKSIFVTNTVINNAAQSTLKLLDGIKTKSLQNPYPMQDLTSINSTVYVAINVISNTLESLIPEKLQDLEEDITVDSIFEDLKLQNSVLQDPKTNASTAAWIEEDLLKKANLMYKLKMTERNKQKSQAKEAEKSVPKLMTSVEYLQNAKMKTLGPGEPAVKIQKKGLHISLQKINIEKLSNTSQAPVGGVEIQFDEVNSNTTNSTGTVEVKQSVFDKPPQMYGKGPASLTSKAIMFSTNNADITLNLKIPNQGHVHSRRYKPVVDAKDPDGLIYLQFPLTNDGDACIIYVKPVGFNINDYSDATLYRLYAKSLGIPSSSSYDFEKILDRRAWTDRGFWVFIPGNLLTGGNTFLGLKPLAATSSVTEAPGMTTSSPSRRKRAAVVGTTSDYVTTEMTTASIETTIAPQYVPSDVEFDLIIATTGCRSWDESQNAWVSDGCVVLPISDLNSTVCRCPESPGNIFATTFVAPNTIDFSTVWGKFDATNAAVYGTIIGLLFVYFIGILILRRKDQKDLIKWQTHFLCDSDSSDCYFYLLTVHTGLRRGAGTKSSVQFVLTGEDLDSGVRMLSDGVNEGFETASLRTFFMGTQEPLGELKYLRIWHDNSGTGEAQSWYLNSLTVDDVQTNIRHVFMCEKWLAIDEDDGMIERILPTCGVENMTKFNTLFSQHTQFNITENHLWLSIVIRPQKSIFTRVQRLSCLLALLFLTMIANAMFFRSSDEEQVTADQVQVGFMRFSLTTLYISFIGILITTPPILFVTYVYKNCKPKPASANKTDKSLLSKLLRRNPKAERANTHEVAKPKVAPYEEFYTVGQPKLPYWTIYIAWTIITLAVLVSSFFLILYSMEWGKDKAEEWLTTFIFSFFESLIFVDPMKVIVIAVLFALLFKKPVNDDKPIADVEKLRSAASKCNSGSLRTYLDFWNDIFVKTQSCSKDHLENMRIRREQEMKAMDTLMTIILYTVFAFILYSISYIERDQRSYNLKANVDNYLYTSSKSQFGFTKVSNTSAYINWLNDTFVPTYYPKDNFNGQPLTGSDLKWFKDLSNVQVGPGRLRQVRTPKDKCNYDRLTWPTPCVENYNMDDQEVGSYCVGWKQYSDAECGTELYRATYITADAWKYVPADEIWGVPISGVYDTYAGGGYILKFTQNYETAQLMIRELVDNNWIDRSTRAVFLEFTLYNANTNLFIYAIFLTEFPDTGGVFTWIQTQTFRPILSLGAMGTYAILCYVLFIIQLLYTTVTTVIEIRKIGLWRFVKVTWNVIDTACVIMSYLAISMFCCRIIYANQAMQMLYDDRLEGTNKFINFQHIVIWDSVYNVLIGILVFIVTIRFLRILGYNKRFTQLAAVVTGAANELSGFSVVFGNVFFAYVMLGHLLFGNTLKEYKGIYTSWASLTNALIGKNSLDSMIRAAPEMAQFFYFTYVFCIVMTLMTMFAAILNQSISDVKSNIENEPDTYGVTDVIKNSVMNVIGIFYKKKGNTVPKKTAPNMMNHGKNFQVDAPNILRFVRGTFDDIGEKQESENEDSHDADHVTNDQSKEDQDEILFQSRPQTSMSNGVPDYSSSSALRAETPGEIQLALDDTDDCAIQNKSEYLAFL